MIKQLIFDFGDVFLELNKQATQEHLQKFGLTSLTPQMIEKNEAYEQGQISTEDFIAFYTSAVKGLTAEEFTEAWNSILVKFPLHRLKFIQQLAQKQQFKLVLLSNTNALHINWVQQHIKCYPLFKACFDHFYLSHEIRLRKPNTSIFEFVLEETQIKAEDCLFIDDTLEHTLGAQGLGIHSWHLQAGKEDVTDLFELKSHLF